MKKVIVILILHIGSLSFAKETFSVSFDNGVVDIEADFELSDSAKGFHINDVSLFIQNESYGKLHLVAEFGWGDSPYDFVCEEISKLKFGNNKYKYASAYGYATTFGWFSGMFSEVSFLIINNDKTFEVSNSYPNAVYDSGFSCYEEPMEY